MYIQCVCFWNCFSKKAEKFSDDSSELKCISTMCNCFTQERRISLGITLAQESSENNGRSKLCNSVNFV